MKVHCPDCRSVVTAAEIDLASGWGKCLNCNEVFALNGMLPGYAAGTSLPFPVVSERPFNSRSIVEQDDHKLLVHVPAQGMRADAWAMLVFAIFWNGFIAFWTAGALGLLFGFGPQGGVIRWGFAAISIPFWLAGFAMLGSVAWAAMGTKTLHLSDDGMTTKTRCGLYSRTRWIERDRLQHARPYASISESNSSRNTNELAVEIVYSKGSYLLPTDSLYEQTWLIQQINSYLDRHQVQRFELSRRR